MDYSDIYRGRSKIYPCSPFVSDIGFTLLMRLCYNEKRKVPLGEITQYIENHQEEINMKNNVDWTALMIVCRNGDSEDSYEIIKLLLDYGANPNLQDNYGHNALMKCIHGYRDLSIKTIKLLLEYGTDVNTQDKDGWTALMMSVFHQIGHTNSAIIDLLLEYNADTKLKTKSNMTALKIAYLANSRWYGKSIIKTLRKKKLKKIQLHNRKLKERNKILKQHLEEYPEGMYIVELFHSINYLKD